MRRRLDGRSDGTSLPHSDGSTCAQSIMYSSPPERGGVAAAVAHVPPPPPRHHHQYGAADRRRPSATAGGGGREDGRCAKTTPAGAAGEAVPERGRRRRRRRRREGLSKRGGGSVFSPPAFSLLVLFAVAISQPARTSDAFSVTSQFVHPGGGHRRGAFVAPTAATTSAAATSTSAGESAAASATLRGGRRIAQSAAAPLTMIGSFFGSSGSSGGGGSDGVGSMMARMNNIEVLIERPTMNSRKISASCIVEKPLADVWSILTDYDNLATHVPNLVESRVLPGYGSPLGEELALFQAQSSQRPQQVPRSCRLYQEGAQKIIGFDFSASVVMDMQEILEAPGSRLPKRAISFKLVQSRFFSEFDGQWTAQVYSRRKVPGTDDEYVYKTKLFYEVRVKRVVYSLLFHLLGRGGGEGGGGGLDWAGTKRERF